MEWVETTGRTLDLAKAAALEQLGVSEADAEVIVVSEPRYGLFGRLKGEARVRARVVPVVPRPKRSRSEGRQSTRSRANRGRTDRSGAEKSGADKSSKESKTQVSDTETREKNGAGGSGRKDRVTGANGVRAQESMAREGSNRRRRGRHQAAAGGRGVRGEVQKERASETMADQGEGTIQGEGTMTINEQAERAKSFVTGLIDTMGLTAEVSVSVVDETVELQVDGEQLGILVGRGGATIAALQEVTRAVVQAVTGGRSGRILVDVAGYRQRRAEALRRFAAQVAAEVRESKEERRLEPMNAADRKVVHDTILGIEGVGTRSEGEEPRRFVVIFPEGSASGTGDDDSSGPTAGVASDPAEAGEPVVARDPDA
jgi:spoIIIJ-associated protein